MRLDARPAQKREARATGCGGARPGRPTRDHGRQHQDGAGCRGSLRLHGRPIVKSLVFKAADDARPLLLLVSGSNRVDEDRVGEIVGCTLIRPDARFVRDQTGFAIGGVPPFGHDRPIATLMDADLLGYGIVWAAAGTPNTVFRSIPPPYATPLPRA